jgi:osmotically-inducible protein OsmY
MKPYLLILASLLVFSACAGPTEPPPTSIKPIDQAVVATVQMNLKTDPELAVAGLKVEAENDLLVLRGTVPNEAAKKRAEEIAKKTHGIEKIANHIDVVQSPDSNVP